MRSSMCRTAGSVSSHHDVGVQNCRGETQRSHPCYRSAQHSPAQPVYSGPVTQRSRPTAMGHLAKNLVSSRSFPGRRRVVFKPHPQLPAHPIMTLKKLVAPQPGSSYTDENYVIILVSPPTYIIVPCFLLLSPSPLPILVPIRGGAQFAGA
ncbi:uncharacterized protein BJX67DRAFT_360890 [Aspergillus lucknowensis]|uniref:Uncharacterized protein n=1 Tax=Aspergillus lucknowensis TaxID=176173 RepID=A0ABR4LJ58_9EURO